MKKAPHKCPVQGCSVMVENSMLTCPTHWSMVPKKLQSEVWFWHHQYQKNPDRFNQQEHEKTSGAAIKAIDDQEAVNAQSGKQGILL